LKKYSDIKSEINVLRFVWKMAKGEHGKLMSVILISILAALIPAGIAYFVKNYIDHNALNFSHILNKNDLTLFFSLIVCGIFLKTISQLIMGYALPNVKRNIEISCISKFSRLPYSYISDFWDNRIIMTLSIESDMLSSLIPMVYRSFIQAPVAIIGFVILLLFVSPMLTLICFVLISIIILGMILFRKAIKRLNKRTYNRIGDLHQYFSEWLAGYKVFFTSNATHFAEKQLTSVSIEVAGLNKKLAKIKACQRIIIETTTIIVTIVFVWIASLQVLSDNISNIGELILFPAAILFIRGEILNIIYGYIQLAGTESAAKRIIDIIEYPLTTTKELDTFNERIETITFSDVTFSYDGSTDNVLESTNITLVRGEINTIVGRSGAGKTTFMNLCMRLRSPQSGNIYYNSKDLNALSENSLLTRIALVEQEPFIFEGTLAENICFDKQPDAPHILYLIEQLGLSHIAANDIELYNTSIGPRNRQLSTGEKQRISLIRALVRNVDVLFLDEVTSNLDDYNAGKIIECLLEIAKEKLIVCVSHDEMIIQNSSRLYEIKEKKIECRSL